MARRRSRPIRLAWERGPSAAPAPARLTLLSRLPARGGHAPRGRLYGGDNLAVMTALLPELEGRVDLIYVDPPFLSGKTYHARIGAGEDSRQPASWKLESGYDDRWPDLAAYLDMLSPRLELLHRLLSRSGTLYVHLDWHAAPYVRVLLDGIFGPGRLLNEIVWLYHGPSPIRTAFSRKHDTILVYTKSSDYTFNADAVRIAYDPATVKAFGASPKAGFGKTPDLVRGKVPEDWWYFPVVARLHRERTGYPTQKPLALLERVILASSRPGDLVADFFCGSGTTLVAAARLGRRWIGCDTSPLAVATTYRRLLIDCPGESLETYGDATERRGRLADRIRLTTEGMTARLRLARQRLVWIEVDWEYDGKVFISRSRAARPWRSATPLPTLEHRYPRPGTYRAALRMADISGRVALQVFECRVGGAQPRRRRRTARRPGPPQTQR